MKTSGCPWWLSASSRARPHLGSLRMGSRSSGSLVNTMEKLNCAHRVPSEGRRGHWRLMTAPSQVRSQMHCRPRIQCWEKPSSPLRRHGRVGWGRNTQGAFEWLPWPRIRPACFYGNRRQARSLLLGAKSLAAVRLSCWLPAGTWKCPFPKPIPCWL